MSTFYGNFAEVASRQASGIQTVLEITLRNNTYGTGRAGAVYLSGGVINARGKVYEPRVARGGWSGFARGFDSAASNLARIETTVEVADTDNKLRGCLEDANQRNSEASFYWVVPGNSADYALRGIFILDAWEYRPGSVLLRFKSDDRALRTYIPLVSILPSEFPYATAEGKSAFPAIIYGSHDSAGLSGKGMVPTLPVHWVENTSAWYCVCLGQAKEVKAVYVNDTKKLADTYTIDYSYSIGGKSFTLVQFAGDTNTPEETDRVTVDVYGYEDTGNTGADIIPPSGTMISNPVQQMSHFLSNHAAGWKSGAWNTTGSLVDPTSWAAVADFVSKRSLEGARYIGGGTEQRQVIDILDEWLDTFGLRGYWLANGTLGIATISAEWPGYRTEGTDPPLLQDIHELGETFSYVLDSSKLTDRYTASYLYDDVQTKYWGTLDVEDPSIGENVTTNVLMPWQRSSLT